MRWTKRIHNKIINRDCLELLKLFPDNYFDLLLTDPPYGIDFLKQRFDKTKTRNSQNKGWGWREVELKDWDRARITQEFFTEMFRVSKNQIIWGGNYYVEFLKPSQGWLVWNKGQRDFSLADGELAFSSFDKALRIFDYARAHQLHDEDRIHPTQKPLKLMKWCLQQARLKENAIVLDCFSGSGATACACDDMGIDFVAIEKDKGYCLQSIERLEIQQSQLSLFG